MKRIWKYVRRVEKHLPLAKRIPVGGAIYAELRDRVKARQAEQGRELTDDEIDAITNAYGDPRQVAERQVACDSGARPLVDRYLAAVGRHLRQDKAHDILAELREAIETRIEEREADSGKALDDEAMSEVLKGFGPPMVAASRYAERDRLIGADLYPFFWPTAKAIVGVVAAAAILLASLEAFTSGRWIGFVSSSIDLFFDLVLPAFATMMIVFIVMDRSDAGKKIAASWEPKTLPQDHIRKPKPLFDSVLGLGFDVLFILWWTHAVDFTHAWGREFEPSVVLDWDGAWAQFHAIILVLACISAAAHLYDVLHPGWSRIRSIVSISGHAVGAYVFAQLARQAPLAVEGPGAADLPDQAEGLLEMINLNLQIVLGLIATVMVIGIVVEGWRLVRSLAEPHGYVAESS